jgi:hypothetical protein
MIRGGNKKRCCTRIRQSATAHSVFFVLLLLVVSCNPFSPALDETSTPVQFGDPHTISGFFQAFKYAYEFKDTTTYGTLLAPDFTFSYRNYDRGVDVTWGRDDEMRTTATLFNNAEAISLQWGNVLDSGGTQTSFDVTISFSLDITFNASDIEHVDGRAVFHLERASPSDIWRAKHWQDESSL